MKQNSNWPHGGNLRALAEVAGIPETAILDFSANINPLGPPGWLTDLIHSSIGRLRHYPDPASTALREAAGDFYGLSADSLLAGNGSSELLYSLLPALKVQRAVIPVPSYHDYNAAAVRAGLETETIPHDIDALAQALGDSSAPTTVLLGRPNNPTGGSLDATELRRIIATHPRAFFVVDEAFADFASPDDRFVRTRPTNAAVLLSATKNFAIPGLRLGLLAAESKLLSRVEAALPPWPVNALAQAAGEAAFRDAGYLERTRVAVRHWREELRMGLGAIPALTVYPSEANFLLVRMQQDALTAAELVARLLRHGIAIRDCSNFAGLDKQHFRVAVRSGEENARLLNALSDELGSRTDTPWT